MILDRINATGDIKKIPKEEYDELACEIREFLLEKTSKNGGHLAANLGVVELTMALHIALDLPKDKIVWDVGHQCYTHKLLTGRKDRFDGLRDFGGMSGFPKRSESSCDCFNTGHSSTSISAALGMAAARDLRGRKNIITAVIGDGSLSGGMAYEALNNASNLDSNLIIILNDNNLSISPSVGGLSQFLTQLRTSDTYNELKTNISHGISNIPGVGAGIYQTISNTKKTLKQATLKEGMLFENLGIKYLGPFDGHNVNQLVRAINKAKKVKGPVLIHVLTKKGKGYAPAEENPGLFHGIGSFDVESGQELPCHRPDNTAVFGRKMTELAGKYKNIVAITAAMADGTGLSGFAKAYPKRFFDVGIAEEHAVTFAAGLASNGMKPFVAVYSSFLQRAYDQILHDVCLQELPVVFAIDRAGITGRDGETHHGIFDLSYLSTIPGLCIIAPKDSAELSLALDYAAEYPRPIAIRYPKGCHADTFGEPAPLEYGKCEKLTDGRDVVVFAAGGMNERAKKAVDDLRNEGIDAGLYNIRFIRPFDSEAVLAAAESAKLIVSVEDNVSSGGIGEHIGDHLMENGCRAAFLNISIPDRFVGQGSIDRLHEMLGTDSAGIADRIRKALERL